MRGPGVSGRSARSRGGNVPIVPVWRYFSNKDYKSRNSIGGSYVPVNCSIADLVRYSLDNGNYEGHIVTSCSGQRFYRSIPGFALECDDGMRRFFMTKDYRHAEVSYKGAVSFYLGMIGARFFFDKFLAGWASGYQLLHAGDSKQFVLTQASGKRKPDLIAINAQGIPYALLEAKGTSGTRVEGNRIRSAKDQLQLARIETLNAAGRAVSSVPGVLIVNKHVIASSFTGGALSQSSVWELCDVDPHGNGEGKLTVDLDAALYARYMPIACSLSRGEVIHQNVGGVDCDLVQIGEGVSVGLVSGLREVIADHGNVTVGFGDQGSGVQERDNADCFHRVSEFFRSMEGFQGQSEGENVSMGGDGVVVVLSDDYVQAFDMEADRASGVS